MHIYSAENHDWDLVLSFAHELLMLGQMLEKYKIQKSSKNYFSCYTGSMILSFSAIESFSASVAFSLPKVEGISEFDFENYRTTYEFVPRINMLCRDIGIDVDWSHGLFQNVKKMQKWRNLVSHSKPYRIESTKIRNTTSDPSKVHRKEFSKQFSREVTKDNAKLYYSTAYDYIDLVKEKSGVNPRTHVSYKIG